MTDKKKSYRALTGIDYKSNETGKYVRVETGDRFDDMNDMAVKYELNAGNIEEWTEELTVDWKEEE